MSEHAVPRRRRAAGRRDPPRWRAGLRSFLELFVLCGCVVAQPLFDVAGRRALNPMALWWLLV
jgi:hypothetical protein